jgi:hypothetical protein
LRIKSLPEFDPLIEEASLPVGDVAHDLRSALDHMAWQLACEFAGESPANANRIFFPICDPKPGHGHKSPRFLDPAVWQRLHEFQPCRGINGRPDSWSGDYVHQLSLLQKMSNQDKHQRLSIVLLTPNAFSTIPTRFSLPPWVVRTNDSFEFVPERVGDPDPDTEDFDFSHAGQRAELGAEVGRVRVPAWRSLPQIEDAGEVTPRIALDGIRPISATLERLADHVQLISSSVELP